MVKTKKNGGNDKPLIKGQKVEKTISVIMYPSAIHGNKKILSQIAIDIKHPTSFTDMIQQEIDTVEEAFAAIKNNKIPKTHIEQMIVKPVY